jgi:choline dehydrogenase-like flavoprotein
MARPNLEVRDCSFVERVVFDGNQAVGVEYVRNGVRVRAEADREVILAAGAYQSPVLLMLSGIGPAEELAPLGIPVREDLPVGRNLQDHFMVNLNYESSVPGMVGIFTPENFELLEKESRGPLTSNYPEAGGFFRTRPGLDAPDIEFHFSPSMFYDQGLTAPHADGYAYGPVVVKPASRGSVTLRTPMADSKPKVCCNFLIEEDDRAAAIEGVRIALELARQPALKAVERAPFSVPDSDSDDDILTWLRREGQSVYHPTSTCAMGSVVDSELRVYGIEGLRVVDASVMPTITRSNTHAPTMMIAEKAADQIRERTPSPASAEAAG